MSPELVILSCLPPNACADNVAGFVSSNELKRLLKQHGADLSLKDMEALAAQVLLLSGGPLIAVDYAEPP